MQAHLITGSFQLSDKVVPDLVHNSTLICMQAYLITGSFLLDSSLHNSWLGAKTGIWIIIIKRDKEQY